MKLTQERGRESEKASQMNQMAQVIQVTERHMIGAKHLPRATEVDLDARWTAVGVLLSLDLEDAALGVGLFDASELDMVMVSLVFSPSHSFCHLPSRGFSW